MTEQPGQTQASAEPTAKKRGAHKLDCKCGWCETKRKNLAKKIAEAATEKPAETPAGVPAAAPAPEPVKAPSIAAKIKAREAKRKNETTPTPAKPAASSDAAPKKSGFFASLFSGPNTFFEG